MKYYVEENLSNFQFWGGAKDNADELTTEQLDRFESVLEELYPDGEISDTQINDIMWFDFDWVKEAIGIEDDEEEEEEEEEREPWKVVNIVWDIKDDEWEDEPDVPAEVEVPGDVDEDDISDWLSDEYGYCVESYELS